MLPPIAQMQVPKPVEICLNNVPSDVKSTSILILLLFLAAFGGVSMLSMMGHFLNRHSPRVAAKRQVKEQMRKRDHDAVGLYIGRFNWSQRVTPPIYLPNAQQGMVVCGGSASERTSLIINPAVRSAIDQGFPVILYDYNYPAQTSDIAGYAYANGYQVGVLAPGFPESDTCNPLELLKDGSDIQGAQQLAAALMSNFQLGKAYYAENPLLNQMTNQLMVGLFLLSKSFARYNDLMTGFALLTTEDIIERLQLAKDQINPWIYARFRTWISATQRFKDPQEATAQMLATLSSHFSRLMNRNILGTFCGDTTIPLDLRDRQLLILGINRDYEDAVVPLIAAVLHMIVTRTIRQKRYSPLVLALDELPTLYLPDLTRWLSRGGVDGLVPLIGFRNLMQLEWTYGNVAARSILQGCASKIIFNLSDYTLSQNWHDCLGEETINLLKNRFPPKFSAKKPQKITQSYRTFKSFPLSCSLDLSLGQCILLNPGYKNWQGRMVPIVQTIRLSITELRAVRTNNSVWEKLKRKLCRRVGPPMVSKNDLVDRIEAVEQSLQRPQRFHW
jgi:type IV secretory pathway TraG/TraD family ATPase VirD4